MHQRGGGTVALSRWEKETAGDEPPWIYRYPIRGFPLHRPPPFPPIASSAPLAPSRLVARFCLPLDCLKSGWKPALALGWTPARIACRESEEGKEREEAGSCRLPRADGSARMFDPGMQAASSGWSFASHQPALARTNGLDLIPTLMPRQATVTHFAPKNHPDPCYAFQPFHRREGAREGRRRRPRGLGAIEWSDRFACNGSSSLLFPFLSSRDGKYSSRILTCI